MTRKPKPAGKLPSWRIVRIASKGQSLTTLSAADAKSAEDLYAEQNGITDDPTERRRLMAVRVE